MKALSDKGKKWVGRVVTSSEIAEILGVTERRIRQLTNDGALAKIARGKYDLPASIKAYIDYRIKTEMPEEELDKQREGALLLRAKRMKAELELKRMEGKMHAAEDVETVMNKMLANFRSRLIILPHKVAPQLQMEEDVNVIKDKIKKEVYEALQELSEYEPKLFLNGAEDTTEESGELDESEKT